MKQFLFSATTIVCFVLLSLSSQAQVDTSFLNKLKNLEKTNSLKMDTAAVPNDALTRKIKQLRKEKGGLDIETVIAIKLAEQQQKDTTHPAAYYDKLKREITTGKTGQLIENCVINLYRNAYTIKEIDELLFFYRTSAGKKMNNANILIIMQSVKDTEELLKMAAAKMQ